MSIQRLLSRWRADPEIGGNITAWETIPPRQAISRPIPKGLHAVLAQALSVASIQHVYSHQELAWDFIRAGKHIVLATGTASGKTLAYNLPVLDALLRNDTARALYIFPTKALAQDQLTTLAEMLGPHPPPSLPIAMATYDGDTLRNHRAAIRKKSRLVVTNPDMLHIGILPHHTAWVDFLSNLEYVVIDEMHTYRGVFGSHVANVIRRLKRITRHYGSQPQFVLTSATIGNPRELASKLIEEELSVISEDGSARGPKHFLIYNPPIVDAELGIRASMVAEAVHIANDLLRYNIQSIVFGRARRTVELILTYLRSGGSADRSIRAYRSGYLPEHRREIEAGLRNGQVRAVVATSALELGIDIGGMGATVQAGYPGSIASTWQQAGRSGRGTEPSLSVLVTSQNPADQFLAHNPDYFFARNPEHALINADNLLILLKHLQSAVFELPFQSDEAFGKLHPTQVAEFLDILHAEGQLHKSKGKYFWMGDTYPSAGVSLRSASAHPILLKDISSQPAKTIGEVDQEAAYWMVHPGAIYLHEAEVFQVAELNLDDYTASLRATDVDYFTRPRRETEIQLLQLGAAEATRGGGKALGELAVITQVSGFHIVRWETHEKLAFHELDLPPTQLITTGFWINLAEETVNGLRAEGLWNSDRNNYGPNWTTQRQAALARDEYRCRFCGALEGERPHHIHHKTPFKAFPSPLEANRLENLITLCPSCHRRAESAVRMRSGLSGLAYTLGHLAPLFLMCDPGDIGVHADPRSPVSEGQPSVIIYEMVPAGIGFSQRLFDIHNELLARARELIGACPCSDGCPSCVGPGGEEGSGGKAETQAIVDALVDL
jgi:DEAD/DEAH box helicase domain-containing protein